MVASLDERFGPKSPFGTVHMIYNLACKGKSRERIMWLFSGCFDLFINGVITKADMPCRKLSQDKNAWVDTLLSKRLLLVHVKKVPLSRI